MERQTDRLPEPEQKQSVFVELWKRSHAFRVALRPDHRCRALDKVKGRLEELWAAKPEVPWSWKDVPLTRIQPGRAGKDLEEICPRLQENRQHTDRVESCEGFSERLLPCLLLPSVREMLFDPFRDEVLWVTFMLYDELWTSAPEEPPTGKYMYRMIYNDTPGALTAADSQLLILLYRLPELADAAGISVFRDWVFDFSDKMRCGSQPDYVLVDDVDKSELERMADLGAIGVSDLFRLGAGSNNEAIRDAPLYLSAKADALISELTGVFSGDRPELTYTDMERLSRLPAGGLGGLHSKLQSVADSLRRKLYQSPDDMPRDLYDAVGGFIEKQLVQRLEGKERYETEAENVAERRSQHIRVMMANYLLWWRATHPKMHSYVVRHAFDFRVQEPRDARRVRPSGIVVAAKSSSDLRELAARAEILIGTALAPLTDYYALREIHSYHEDRAMRAAAKGLVHNIKNLLAGASAPADVVRGYLEEDILKSVVVKATPDNTKGWLKRALSGPASDVQSFYDELAKIRLTLKQVSVYQRSMEVLAYAKRSADAYHAFLADKQLEARPIEEVVRTCLEMVMAIWGSTSEHNALPVPPGLSKDQEGTRKGYLEQSRKAADSTYVDLSGVDKLQPKFAVSCGTLTYDVEMKSAAQTSHYGVKNAPIVEHIVLEWLLNATRHYAVWLAEQIAEERVHAATYVVHLRATTADEHVEIEVSNPVSKTGAEFRDRIAAAMRESLEDTDLTATRTGGVEATLGLAKRTKATVREKHTSPDEMALSIRAPITRSEENHVTGDAVEDPHPDSG
jgi:hypothetical protein